jgi:hypothetical protein
MKGLESPPPAAAADTGAPVTSDGSARAGWMEGGGCGRSEEGAAGDGRDAACTLLPRETGLGAADGWGTWVCMGVLALDAAVLALDGAAAKAWGIIGADMGRSLACGAWVGCHMCARAMQLL